MYKLSLGVMSKLSSAVIVKLSSTFVGKLSSAVISHHNRKYHATALSSPDHFLNKSAFRKLDINQSQVLKFNQAS